MLIVTQEEVRLYIYLGIDRVENVDLYLSYESIAINWEEDCKLLLIAPISRGTLCLEDVRQRENFNPHLLLFLRFNPKHACVILPDGAVEYCF